MISEKEYLTLGHISKTQVINFEKTLLFKFIIQIYRMGETGETEREGEKVRVEKDEGEQNQNLAAEEAKMKAARVKKMEQL